MIRFKIQIVVLTVGDLSNAYRRITWTLRALGTITDAVNNGKTLIQTGLHIKSGLKDCVYFELYYKDVFVMVRVKFLKKKNFPGPKYGIIQIFCQIENFKSD